MAMTISYNKLWKVLVDKKMSKADLRRATEMASNTMTSLRRDKKVSMDVLLRICEVLDCDIGDIMSVHKKETENVFEKQVKENVNLSLIG